MNRFRISLKESSHRAHLWAGCGVKCLDELKVIPGTGA